MLSSNEEGVERRESRKTLKAEEEEGRETSRTGGRSGREGVVESVTGHGETSQHMGCGYGGGGWWRNGRTNGPEMWGRDEGRAGGRTGGEESDR